MSKEFNRAIIIPLRLRKGANYDSKYTISSSNSGLGQVLITVENSKSFSLQYSSELLELFRRVNVSKHDIPLKSSDPISKPSSSNTLLKVILFP